jgi:hypothetical protein
VHRLLTEGIASGEVVPLPFNTFDRVEVSDAFRFMAAGMAPRPSESWPQISFAHCLALERALNFHVLLVICLMIALLGTGSAGIDFVSIDANMLYSECIVPSQQESNPNPRVHCRLE